MGTPVTPDDYKTVEAYEQRLRKPFDGHLKRTIKFKDCKNEKFIWECIQGEAKYWRGHLESTMPGWPRQRELFWGKFAEMQKGIPPTFDLVEKYCTEQFEQKVAIDLGCGNSVAAKHLLNRGWHVIAVDSSEEALNTLEQLYDIAVQTEQLEIVPCDVESYEPEEPADLVIARDVMPYLNPATFQETWKKIHDCCLKDGGVFIGSFFRVIPRCSPGSPSNSTMNAMRDQGAWFLPDDRMVQTLLEKTGYEVKEWRIRQHPDQKDLQSPIIDFVAVKKTPNQERS